MFHAVLDVVVVATADADALVSDVVVTVLGIVVVVITADADALVFDVVKVTTELLLAVVAVLLDVVVPWRQN